MKGRALTVLLFLLLTGCSAGYTDPLAMRAAAEAYIEATRQAEIQQERGTEMAAAETRQAAEAEMALIEKRIEATQAAWGVVVEQARATRVSAELTVTAPAIQATHTAIAVEVERELSAARRDAEIGELMGLLEPLVVVLAALLVTLLLVVYVPRIVDWWIEWKNRREMLQNTFAGVAVYESEYGSFRLLTQPQPLPRRLLDMNRTNEVYVSPGGVMAVSEVGRKYDTRLLEMVEAAMERGYGESNIIPGHRDLGMSGSVWSRVTDELRRAGLVEVQAGRKILRVYSCLGELHHALMRREVDVPNLETPTPAGGTW
jgi:hypothetical protein